MRLQPLGKPATTVFFLNFVPTGVRLITSMSRKPDGGPEKLCLAASLMFSGKEKDWLKKRLKISGYFWNNTLLESVQLLLRGQISHERWRTTVIFSALGVRWMCWAVYTTRLMEKALGEELHVDPECLPVAHAWDPSDLMNGGKWVTIADITYLGHSKREERKDGRWETFDGRNHVLLKSCACDPVLLQQVMKGQHFDKLQLKETTYCIK